MLRSGLAANIPMYIHSIDKMTQARDNVANLLTNATPINTMMPSSSKTAVPYTR